MIIFVQFAVDGSDDEENKCNRMSLYRLPGQRYGCSLNTPILQDHCSVVNEKREQRCLSKHGLFVAVAAITIRWIFAHIVKVFVGTSALFLRGIRRLYFTSEQLLVLRCLQTIWQCVSRYDPVFPEKFEANGQFNRMSF